MRTPSTKIPWKSYEDDRSKVSLQQYELLLSAVGDQGERAVLTVCYEGSGSQSIKGDMDSIGTMLSGEKDQATLREATAGGQSSGSSSVDRHVGPSPLLEKIDDHIYQVDKPAGTPSIEIVFFHGIQLEDFKEEASVRSWKSECSWVRWLQDDFPEARIVRVSYDDAKSSRTGEFARMRGENLVHSLTRTAQIGQTGGPVLLVGHCLAGTRVMKALCCQAKRMLTQDWSDDSVDNFLINLKGLLFYGTPPNNNGSSVLDSEGKLLIERSHGENLFAIEKKLKPGRSNEIFQRLCKRYRWKTLEVAELLVEKTTREKEFSGRVVPEVSSITHDNSSSDSVFDHHHTRRRLFDGKSSSYGVLTNFMSSLLTEAKKELRHDFGAPWGSSPSTVGLEALAEQVEDKLRSQWRVGIVGMGGIGKATLARAVFKKMSKNFEYTCFFEQVRKATAVKEQLKTLQAKILARLYNREGTKVENLCWNHLRGQKVLLVMNDVDSINQLRVMNSCLDFDSESRLIVTSRTTSFLEEQKFETLISMERLNSRDSAALFCLHAFKDKFTIPEDRKRRLPRLIDKCRGLPLALKVVGAYLSATTSDWDGALQRMCKADESLDGNDNKDEELSAIWRMSYDCLAPREKQMFLDVATCFHGDELNSVQEAWRVADWDGGSPDSVWQNLVDKCLVSEHMNPCGEGSPKLVWMHELLRDFGRSLACPQPQGDKVHLRVNGILEAQRLLSHIQENTTVKVLRIVDWPDSPGKPLDISFLSKLPELRILWLEGAMDFTGECDSLPKQLRFLRIDERHSYPRIVNPQVCGLRRFLPILRELQSLRSLMLNCPTLDSVPDSVGNLVQLEFLEIQCSEIGRLPETLGTAPSLQQLYLIGCRELHSLPDNLGNSQSLRRLHLIDCGKLQRLPQSLGQHQISDVENCLGHQHGIKHLVITGCSSLSVSTAVLGQLHALQHLRVRGCRDIVGCYELICEGSTGQLTILQSLTMKEWILLKVAPLEDLKVIMYNEFSEPTNGLPQLQVLTELSIDDCHSTTSLPECLLRQLWDLQCLTISNSWLENVPEAVGFLGKLKKFRIYYCHVSTAFSDALGNLQALEELEISSCNYLTTLSESLGNLHALKQLTLEGLSLLEVLPESLGHVEALQNLTISHCFDLRTLPESFKRLTSLQELNISNCWLLQALPDDLGQLPALQRLTITDCRELRVLPDTLGQLEALEEFSISVWDYRNCAGPFTTPDTSELRALPDSLGHLSALRQLTIARASELTVLPESLGFLRALERLTISECDSLRTLPDSFGQLEALQHLIISQCNALRSLPESLGDLHALQHLTISQCNALRSLPESLGDLHALQHLKIWNCHGLQKFPMKSLGQLQTLQQLTIFGSFVLQESSLPLEFLGQLQVLQQLHIADHLYLKAFPECLWNLHTLQRLEITGSRVGLLPESVGQLQALQQLTISGCHVLKVLPESLGQLQALQQLTISSCHLLKALPESLGQLQALRQLTISFSDKLTALPRSCTRLQALEDLTISSCNSFKQLPASLGLLRKLQHLTISNCPSLKVLPQTIGQVSSLRSLNLAYCRQLTLPPDTSAQLPPSLNLRIESCGNIIHTLRKNAKSEAEPVEKMNCGPGDGMPDSAVAGHSPSTSSQETLGASLADFFQDSMSQTVSPGHTNRFTITGSNQLEANLTFDKSTQSDTESETEDIIMEIGGLFFGV